MSERRIGPYQVVAELGRGGMGVVYAARHLQLGREVALKLMLDPDSLGATAPQRFEVEAQAVARLRHPGIVSVHELGKHGARPYLVMDFVRGESLGDRLKRLGSLELRAAAELVRDMASAMQHAHEQGILHRDLKPANVLLDTEGRPRITDFGLAKDLCAARERLTRTGQLIGTPAYMPPEQADGQLDAIGPATDVYALGATLFAALTGRPPFEGSAPMNVVAKLLTKEAPLPSSLRAEVPTDLDAICQRCLEKEPAARYASAAALAEDLTRFLQGEQIEAELRVRRRSAGFLMVALVVISALTILGWGAFNVVRGEDPAPPEPEPVPEEVVLDPVPSGPPSWALASALLTWLERNPPPLGGARGDEQRKSAEAELRSLARDPLIEEPCPVAHSIARCPDAFAVGSAEGLRILEPGAPKRRRVIPIHAPSPQTHLYARAFAVDPDGRRAVVASEHGGGVTNLYLVDLEGQKEVARSPVELALVNTIAVNWERGRIFVGGKDLERDNGRRNPPMHVLELESFEPKPFPGMEEVYAVRVLAVDPASGRLAASFERTKKDGAVVRVLDAEDQELGLMTHTTNAPSLAWGPDGALAVGTEDGWLYRWEPGGEPRPLAADSLELSGITQPPPLAHVGSIVDLAFAQEGVLLSVSEQSQGNVLLTGLQEKQEVPNFRAWDWAKGKELQLEGFPRTLPFKPGGLAVTHRGRCLAITCRRVRTDRDAQGKSDAELENSVWIWYLPELKRP